MEYTLIIIVLIIVIYLLLKVLTLEDQIKGLKYKLNQLMRNSGMPEYPINNELRKLISEGKEVKAVKRARETLGLSLVEGKKYIDELKKGQKT